jgi:glycosyltransferase involved in cell wall biosynthesis
VSGPLVSVIMIFLDAERFIEEAIESVFAQTWPHWELLLVDDGSSDRSTTIAKGYAGRHPERVRYLEHPGHVNRGTGPSRNLGMSAAAGRYLAFLDADDTWLPERLEQHVAVLESLPEVGMTVSAELYWHSWDAAAAAADERVIPSGPTGVAIPPPAFLPSTLANPGGAMPGICSITLRCELVDELGGIDDAFVDNYEDQVLIAKVALTRPVYLLDACLSRYRQHPGSLTRRLAAHPLGGRERAQVSRFDYLRWHESWLRRRGIADPTMASALEQALSRQGRSHLNPAAALTRSLTFARCALGVILPARAYHGLLRWHGAWKQRRVQRRLGRLLAARPHDGRTGDGS